jgi:small GTP-binding protein
MVKKNICMLGSFGVGKSSLVARYVHSIFRDRYETTVGVKIQKKVVAVGSEEVTLMLWDLPGEEDGLPVNMKNVQKAEGYILVVDGCRGKTLDVALSLHDRARETTRNAPFVLLINKSDQKEAWEIDASALQRLASDGWILYETSAKTGDHVEEAFLALAVDMLKVTHGDTGAVAESV